MILSWKHKVEFRVSLFFLLQSVTKAEPKQEHDRKETKKKISERGAGETTDEREHSLGLLSFFLLFSFPFFFLKPFSSFSFSLSLLAVKALALEFYKQ